MALYLDEGRQGVLDGIVGPDARRALISDFGRAEFASGVSLAVRQARLSRDTALALLASIDLLARNARVSLTAADIARATELVERFEWMLRAPDAIHVAIAERLDMPLVTFDDRQAAAARRVGVEVLGATVQE